MKPTVLVFVLALALAGGLAVWFGRSGAREPAPRPDAPPAQPAAEMPRAETPLETPPAERSGAAQAGDATAKPDARASLAEQPKPQPPPLDPSVIAGGLDGGAPSDAGAMGNSEVFEVKYKGASKAELETQYQALERLYQDNLEGRVDDKSKALSGDALDELAREVAWLKQQARDGG